MSSSVSDDALKRAYAPFGRTRERHRRELLEAIATMDGTQKDHDVRKGRRRLAGVALSLAAILLVGVTLAVTFWPPAASSASAVEEARERLLGVQSLHVKGWMYETVEKDGKLVVERFPYEFYVERPGAYYHVAYGFSFEGNYRLTKVMRSYVVNDGERSMRVSHNQRRAVIRPESRLATRLRAERLLQRRIFDRLIVGLPDAYRHVGTEEVDGVPCDVYEYRETAQDGTGRRRHLWLDAASGTPVRMKDWQVRASGAEEPSVEYETIRVNGPRPDGLFSFEAPEGYDVQVMEGEAEPLTLPEGAGASGNGHSLWTWISFNIDDRAVLYCWWVDPPIEQGGLFQRVPEFSLGRPGEERPCRYVPVRTDPRWNWSLLLPQDEDGRIDLDDQLSVVVEGNRARLHAASRPLKLSDELLEQILREAQRLTILPGSDIEPFTLEQIRKLIGPGS